MYKVFDVHPKEGVPQFIFHGVNKSRTMPFNMWLEAEKKWVTDGSCSTKYLSGFHVFPDEESIREWCRTVTNIENRAVAKVSVKGKRNKSHSKHSVILADKMHVTKVAW